MQVADGVQDDDVVHHLQESGQEGVGLLANARAWAQEAVHSLQDNVIRPLTARQRPEQKEWAMHPVRHHHMHTTCALHAYAQHINFKVDMQDV